MSEGEVREPIPSALRATDVSADETRYRELFQHAPFGIALVALDGRLLDVNPRALEIHGFPRDQIVGFLLSSLEILHAEDVPRLRDLFQRVVAGEVLPPLEARLHHREGDTRWVEATVLRLERDGAPWAVQILFRDITDRKKTERALRRSLERYRTLLDSAADGILLLRGDGTIFESNRGAGTLLGARPEELVGQRIQNLVAPEDLARRPLAIRNLDPGDSIRVERTLRHREGRRLPAEIEVKRLEDGRLMAVIRDVSERREAERALAESELRLRATITGAPLVLFAVDVEGTFTFSYGRALEKLGLLPGELVGESIYERYADVPELADAIRAALAGRHVDRVVGLGGLDWEVHCEPLEDGQGEIVGATGVATDITERRRAERALRRSEARYRALAEHSAVGIWQITPEGHTIYANPEMLALLEVEDLGALAGSTYHRFFDAEGIATIEGERSRRGSDAASSYRIGLLTAKGRRREVVVSGAPILDSRGQVSSRIGTFVDVTAHERAEAERRRLEERVRQSQRLESLGILAGGVAHDFNNLLTGVLGNAGLALARLAPDHRAYALVQRIEQSARWAADLTQQLLAYAGRGQVIVRPLDLTALVEEMSDHLTTVVPEGVDLHLDLHPVPRAHADLAQMRQVILNLVRNAGEACRDGEGGVRVETRGRDVTPSALEGVWEGADIQAGPHVLLAVRDDGEGMDPAARPFVFDPFFSTKATGRGLGLAAVLGIIRAHGGALRLESTPGLGTTFEILLPAGSQIQEPRMPSTPRKGIVLIIEDQDAVRDMATRALEFAGFEVVAAPDGEAGIRAFEARKDDVVLLLLDAVLEKGLDSASTLSRLKALRPDLVTVLTSGGVEDEVAIGCGLRKDQYERFLPKPYRTARLEEIVAEYVKP